MGQLVDRANCGVSYPKHAIVAAGVFTLHVAALTAFQGGLSRRVPDIQPVLITMAALLGTDETTRNRVEPAPPASPPKTGVPLTPLTRPTPEAEAPREPPAFPATTQLETAPTDSPATSGPTASTTPPERSALPATATTTTLHSPPVALELPSSAADYLKNPQPPYPTLSRRLREQGKVVVRVLIDTDGMAKQAQIGQSSGYERLDQVALATVKGWRYVPGKRAGVPEAMWFHVPINFVLE